jgi:hypothetical protein
MLCYAVLPCLASQVSSPAAAAAEAVDTAAASSAAVAAAAEAGLELERSETTTSGYRGVSLRGSRCADGIA